MSLLDHEDDPFDLEPVELGRSNTGSPLMEAEGGESFSLHRPKEKKDRKARLAEDKKGSSLSLRKPRQSKEPASDKTPKRGKHVRSKSGSRTPPDSPKAAKAAEAKRQARGGSAQLHPSPNVKSNRKRYSQLGGQSSSESDLEEDSGLFVSNRATTEEHETSPTPQQSIEQKTVVSATNTAHPYSPPRSPTHHPDFTFPTSIMQRQAIPNLGMLNVRRSTIPMTEPATTPERPVRMSVQDHQSAGVQELHSPGQLPHFPTMQFFQTPQPPPALHPFSVPSQSTALPPATVEDEWAISEELQQKCKRQFLDLQPESGLLLGDKARTFFLQSKLPNQELSQIWRLADVDGDNALSEQEFTMAMKLVLMRRKGHSIPAALPEGVRLKPRDGDGVFSDSFVPQQQPQAAPPPPVKSTQSVADLAPPPPRESSTTGTTTKPKLAHVVQKSAPNLLGPDPGIAEQPAVSQDTCQEEGQGEGHGTEPMLEEHNTSDTGRLVTAQSSENTEASAESRKAESRKVESRKAESRKAAVPVSKGQEPAIGRIISIDADSEEEGEEDESTAFFQRRKRTSSEGTVQKDLPQEQSSPKPLVVGPVRRSKSLRHTPSHPDPLVDSHRIYAEDGDPSPKGDSETTPIITLDLPLPKPAPRKGSRSAAVDKSKYSSLGFSATSPTGPAHEDKEEGADSPSESPVLALKERGHARSTSLDLKKMLKDGGGQAHTGLPSAVPPKPPPKPAPARGTATAQEDDKPVARARSASTGSISSTGVASSLDRSEEHVLDVSAEALLLAPRPPPTRPKPQRKAPLVPPNYKPKRPPPPRPKPTAVETPPTQPVQEDTLPSLRDKAALQSTIRSLQETNATLRAINQDLEGKLFKIMEDRVQLGRELELAREAAQ